jgi:MFS family permease
VNATGDLAEYALAIRSFSRNARLFIVHVIGMDTVHGTSLVLVNLYFLAVGFPIEFIGLRLLLSGIAGAMFSVPAGLISDRIGRKWSFIVGDGVGAALYLITIFSVDQSVLLATGVLGAMSGTLHGVSEPAFMAENSEQRERVHLFSVSDGLRTLSAMVGSLLGGFVPVLAASLADKVTLYRVSIFIGIAIWALSLIPALMLRGRDRPLERGPTGRRQIFAGVRHPARVLRLVAVGAIASLGFGFVGPLFNVFFFEGLHAHTHDIGMTFASGEFFLALAALADDEGAGDRRHPAPRGAVHPPHRTLAKPLDRDDRPHARRHRLRRPYRPCERRGPHRRGVLDGDPRSWRARHDGRPAIYGAADP